MCSFRFWTLSCLLVIMGSAKGEPEYCKRGVKISKGYQECFEEAHFMHPYVPLRESHDVIDGCMVEAYATHVCRVTKPAALKCFREFVNKCNRKSRLLAIADQSGGACTGNDLSKDFKEHVLNFLQPVRGDSKCFAMADRAYECYTEAGNEMTENNPRLDFLSVTKFMPVANQFFDTILKCYIRVYESNAPLCENWQVPLLLELQGTALPSLYGMTFTPEQMDRLKLTPGCPKHGILPFKPPLRRCTLPPPTQPPDQQEEKDDQKQKPRVSTRPPVSPKQRQQKG